MSVEARIARLEAAEHIRRLKAHYSDLCDEGYDPDKLAALFTEDGAWDGGQLGCFEGRAAVRRFFERMPKVLSFAVHHVTNPSITVADDALSAKGSWYLLQTATQIQGNRAMWIAGRYSDDFVQRDGRWLFKRITIKTRFFTPYDKGWAEVPFAS